MLPPDRQYECPHEVPIVEKPAIMEEKDWTRKTCGRRHRWRMTVRAYHTYLADKATYEKEMALHDDEEPEYRKRLQAFWGWQDAVPKQQPPRVLPLLKRNLSSYRRRQQRPTGLQFVSDDEEKRIK